MHVKLPVRFKMPANYIFHYAGENPVYDYPYDIGFYLLDNMKYPVGIVKNKIIDTINVHFVVKPDKSIGDMSVGKNNDSLDGYDYEAMRLVRNIKIAQPAFINKAAVAVMLDMPVIFNY
jgi:hypothetical protein